MHTKHYSNGLSAVLKIFAIFLVAALVLSSTPLIMSRVKAATNGKKVSIYVNKKKINISKKFAAKKVGNVVLAPSKQLAKALKAKYKFTSNKVVFKRKGKTTTLIVNSKKAKLGKKTFKLRKKVTLTNGMPMVDAVRVAKQLGYKYSKYRSGKKALYIASSKSKLPGGNSNNDSYEEEYTSAVPTPTPTPTPTPVPTFSIDPNAGADTYRKTGLPIVFINTDNGSDPIEKDAYQTAMMCIEETGPGGVKLLEDTAIEIAIRGNSTSNATKKPYKFRFVDNADGTNNKKEVLGMAAHHKWNLLANAYDKSLLRNAVALKFASQLSGLDFTPEFKFVDVVLNGDYIGNYMLTERVEIANERVNIKKKNEAGDKFGYIVEWDQRSAQSWTKNELGWDYFNVNMPTGTVAFAYKDPEPDDFWIDYDGSKRTYIANDVIMTWEKIFAASETNTEFLDYIDLDSFIDFYMVQELMMPVDGYNFSSIYFYKDSIDGAKMHAGPAWDYDLALGNSNPDQINNIYYHSAPYCSPLKNNSSTKQKYIDRWTEIQPIAAEMLNYIDATAKEIKASAELNYQRWSISTVDQYEGTTTFTSYDEAVASLRKLFEDRYTAMNITLKFNW